MDLNLIRKSPSSLSLRLKHYDITFSVKHIFPIQDISTIAAHLNQQLPLDTLQQPQPPVQLPTSTEPMIVWHHIYDPDYQRQLEYQASKIVVRCTAVKKPKGKAFVVEARRLWTRSAFERAECHPRYAAKEKMALGNLNITRVQRLAEWLRKELAKARNGKMPSSMIVSRIMYSLNDDPILLAQFCR